MKAKKSQPAFIEFANLPRVPDGLRVPDGFDYEILILSHRNIKKILDQIIKNPQQSRMSKELKFFIYNEAPYPFKFKFIMENGNLNLTLVYDLREERIGSWLEPKWFRNMKIELLNYLKDKNEDKRKLKKCPICKKYYIAENVRRFTRCYSDECEKAYQRNKKRKQREEDPVRYF
jgi:hypothetical protein